MLSALIRVQQFQSTSQKFFPTRKISTTKVENDPVLQKYSLSTFPTPYTKMINQCVSYGDIVLDADGRHKLNLIKYKEIDYHQIIKNSNVLCTFTFTSGFLMAGSLLLFPSSIFFLTGSAATFGLYMLSESSIEDERVLKGKIETEVYSLYQKYRINDESQLIQRWLRKFMTQKEFNELSDEKIKILVEGASVMLNKSCKNAFAQEELKDFIKRKDYDKLSSEEVDTLLTDVRMLLKKFCKIDDETKVVS